MPLESMGYNEWTQSELVRRKINTPLNQKVKKDPAWEIQEVKVIVSIGNLTSGGFICKYFCAKVLDIDYGNLGTDSAAYVKLHNIEDKPRIKQKVKVDINKNRKIPPAATLFAKPAKQIRAILNVGFTQKVPHSGRGCRVNEKGHKKWHGVEEV